MNKYLVMCVASVFGISALLAVVPEHREQLPGVAASTIRWQLLSTFGLQLYETEERPMINSGDAPFGRSLK
jgi:hypothetical protein